MTRALLLDEMHAAVVASTLRERGHDVICVTDRTDLRGMTDEELYRWAAQAGRTIVTENVKDFRPILLNAEESGTGRAGLLFTSSRTFPRSRKNPGPMIDAIDEWLRTTARPPVEAWLSPVKR